MADNTTGLTAPSGLNHLVLNVRNMDESHAFWTEVVGLKQVGKLKARPDRPNPPNMQFYSCDHAGKDNHHDIALVENPNLPEPPKEWGMFGMPQRSTTSPSPFRRARHGWPGWNTCRHAA
jgi:catechol 2,3-dioxygenase-like lactoylglutathione lyase family enzyme